MREETRRLGRQYGEEYFAAYGRGPFQCATDAPYRLGEPLWQNYFGAIADLIVAELAPRTVLDAGCAIGFLVQALRARGVEAWGIDISEYAIEHVDDTVRPFCSIGSVTDEFERDYDLIVCIEVIEHLPQHLAPVAVANFSRHTNGVLFSASSDGFRDPTHLNVQPTDYWVELFGRQGFFRNLDVDASVISPQAIHFLRAEQTAVSVACAYERWHWRTLTELRDLRAARQSGSDEFFRAEHANAEIAELHAEIAELRRQLAPHEAIAASARSAASSWYSSRRLMTAEIEHHKAEAERVWAELSLLQQTRILRYTSLARRFYGLIRRSRRDVTISNGAIVHAIDTPREGQIVAADFLMPVTGWVICRQGLTGRVDVSVNGLDFGGARLGLPRPDVADVFDRADASISGFETLIDIGTLPPDAEEARIELRVETLSGGHHRLEPITVRVPPRQEQRGMHRMPVPHSARHVALSDDIRMLVFTHHLGLGGGQLYLFELLRLLAPMPDFAATVVAPNAGPLREATEELGIPVVIDGPHPLGNIDQYEGRQAELLEWARAGEFNIVLANTFGCFPGVDLADRLALPAVWAIHESFDVRSFWRAAYGSVEAVDPSVKARAEAALASAAAVVFEADATRELFAHHGDPNRFVTVPYGIDIEAIDRYVASVSPMDARKRLEMPADATILLCLGTVEPRKGQAALAEAFSAVAPDHPEAMLVFVGAGSDAYSEALKSFIQKSGFTDRILVVPVASDIQLWYRAADALICASDVESLPRTVLEAMAFSIPVIATRVFGVPELIDDGITGYLCEPRDIRDLARVLDRFLNTSVKERKIVSAAGASLVSERHDSHRYADAYHVLLKSLVGDPSRPPSEILANLRV